MLTLCLLLACTDPPPLSCSAELADAAPSVATVRWHTDVPAEGFVRYGIDAALDQQTAAVQATDHSHELWGLPPDADIAWQAVATVDGTEQSCEGTLHTPALPGFVAELTVSGQPVDDDDGVFLASVWETGTYASQILAFDHDGVVRWYLQGDYERFIIDVQPALDGVGLLHDQVDSHFTDNVGVIRHLSWTGALLDEAAMDMGHHMFVQLPDGGLAYQQLDVRDWTDPSTGETEPVVGDAIVEVAVDGTQRTLFSVWDWIEVQDNQFSTLGSIYPQGQDWTHGNALKYDDDTGRFLLSLGNAGMVLSVDRDSGELVDAWGAEGIPVAEGSPELEHQHDPTWLDADHLLVFDSHFSDVLSGAFEYALVDGELQLVWSHTSPDDLFALILGQATRLPGGGTRVNFGSAGRIEEVDADGAVAWSVDLPEGMAFGQVRWLPGMPRP